MMHVPLRLAAVTLVAGLAVLLSASPASAHSVLLSSTPARDSAITAAPSRVVLEFNEQPEARFTELAVIGPDGASHWEDGTPSIVDNTVSAPLRVLGPAGGYTIRYRVTSADGHPVSGAIPFTLTVAGSGTPTPAVAAIRTVEPMPLWPWLTGGVIFLLTGVAVARRLARVERREERKIPFG
jgi:methionine-rich copper-binding protein CopC